MDATNSIRKRVASNIHSLMKQAGIQSQAQLADIAGVSQTQIGNILRGKRAASIDLLERLADGLGCEPWVLLSPTDHVDAFGNSDLQVMLHCYLRLSTKERRHPPLIDYPTGLRAICHVSRTWLALNYDPCPNHEIVRSH